jgi:hypothetical protein
MEEYGDFGDDGTRRTVVVKDARCTGVGTDDRARQRDDIRRWWDMMIDPVPSGTETPR